MGNILRSQIGLFFGLGFCLATAASTTLVHYSSLHLDPFFSLFCTTLIAIFYFHAIKIRQVGAIYVAAIRERKTWFLISVMVAGNWMASFYALSKINSFEYVYTYFSASAIIGGFAQYTKSKSHQHFLTAGALTILLSVFFKHLTDHASQLRELYIGMAFAIISAGFGYGYRHFSVQFSQKTQLDAVSVLAVRFYLLLPVSLLFAHHNQFHLFTPHQAAYFAALAAITFLIPLYCMQNCVLLIGANYFSILTALCPAMTATILWCFEGVHADFNLLVSFAIFFVLLSNGMVTLYGGTQLKTAYTGRKTYLKRE